MHSNGEISPQEKIRDKHRSLEVPVFKGYKKGKENTAKGSLSITFVMVLSERSRVSVFIFLCILNRFIVFHDCETIL